MLQSVSDLWLARGAFSWNGGSANDHHFPDKEPLYGPYYASKGPMDNHLAALSGAALGLASAWGETH